jgi:hypothetical protein
MADLTPAAQTAVTTIRKLQKYPIPQTTQLAIQRVLKNLSLQDYTQVVLELERTNPKAGAQ